MESDCLTTEDLARLAADGIASVPEAVEAHLAACDACKEMLSVAIAACDEQGALPVGAAIGRSVIEAVSGGQAVARVRLSLWRRPAVWGALAAAGVLVMIAGTFWRDEPSSRRFTIPAGEAVRGTGETFATTAGQTLPLLLPEGSRIRVGSGSRIRCLPPEGGERVHVALDAGSLEAEVISAPGAVRISAPAGTVSVVGTTFAVRAITVHAPMARAAGPDAGEEGKPVFEAAPILAVEVREGTVELSGAAGTLRVAGGWRGIVWPGGKPLLQEGASMTWEQAALQFGRGWDRPDFARSSGCATLLAWDWKGAASWIDALADRKASVQSRQVAAALAGLTAGPVDAERLSIIYRNEMDAAIRAVLKPHLERLGVEEKE